MKKLRAIYGILTSKYFIAFTAKESRHYRFNMKAHPKHVSVLCNELSKAMSKKADAIEADAAVETAKNIITGTL